MIALMILHLVLDSFLEIGIFVKLIFLVLLISFFLKFIFDMKTIKMDIKNEENDNL